MVINAEQRKQATSSGFQRLYEEVERSAGAALLSESTRAVRTKKGRRKFRVQLSRMLGRHALTTDLVGTYSTDYAAMVKLARVIRKKGQRLSAQDYFDYKTLTRKLLGRVGGSYIKAKLEEPGLARRIFGMSTVGTTTGRLSSSRPNLSNTSKGDQRG